MITIVEKREITIEKRDKKKGHKKEGGRGERERETEMQVFIKAS
jgi:hypothetical protein